MNGEPSDLPAPPAPLALLELLDREGRALHVVPVRQWPARIGRAIDNDLVLDDPHVAPHHAHLEAGDDGIPVLVAQPSLNGVQVGGRRLAGGERMPLAGAGIPWTVGTQRLRLRLAGEALAPERPLHAAPGHRGTLLMAAVLWAWMLAGHAISLDPGAKLTEWLPAVLGLPAALTGWCLAWALVSKLFQHRFDFWPHVAVAVRYLLAAEALEFLLTWTAALTSWEVLSRISSTASAAVVVAMLVAHARLVLPLYGRTVRLFAASAFIAGAGVLAAQNLQRIDRLFSELYMTALPPPALVHAPPVSTQEFLQDAAALRPGLDSAALEGADEPAAAGSDEEE